jgi:trimeric autotransporter adhesin
MSISGIQGNSSLLSELSTSSLNSSSSTSTGKNAFNSALTNLFSAIQSGDTASAQKYMSQVQQLSPSNADSSSPLGQFLSTVSSALQNNDISTAQSALTTLESQAASSSATSGTSSSTSSGALSSFTQDLVSLFSSISSGDLSGAQSAYDQLTSLLFGSSTSSSSSSTSSTDTSTSSSSSTSGENSFAGLLKQIGSALSTGDISSAQSALDSFLQSLSSGSLVSTTA